MVFDYLSKYFGVESSNVPNTFTLRMGKLIREARLEAGLSQVELGKLAYFRQASISDIENGKREVTSGEIVYFSNALKKPILYFFPERFRGKLKLSDLSVDQQEFLSTIKMLDESDLKKIIAQIKAIIEISDL